MDSDNTLSAIVLSLSLVVFVVAWLIEASFNFVGKDGLKQLVSRNEPRSPVLESLLRMPMGPSAALTVLRFLALSASVIAVVILVIKRDEADWLYVSLMTFGLLLFVGLVYTYAQVFGRIYGERIVLDTATLVRVLSWIVFPLTWPQQRLIRNVLASRGHPDAVEEEADPGDLPITLTTNGEPLDEAEQRMIRGVVRLDETSAREIMVPRVDIAAVALGASMTEVVDKMLAEGHSRLPIYDETIDRIQGIAHARDLLHQLSKGDGDRPVDGDMIRSALFIPETKTLEELLEEFKSSHVHMAIVVDEYGGVSGLVTIEDLLEEIVGDIMDEFDYEEPEVKPVGENQFLLDAGVGLDEIKDLLGVTVEGDGFDTLGGFVYDRLGKIPDPGDSLTYDTLLIEVVSTEGRRLKTLRVTKKPEAQAEDARG